MRLKSTIELDKNSSKTSTQLEALSTKNNGAHLGPAENGTKAKLSICAMFSGKKRDGRNSWKIYKHKIADLSRDVLEPMNAITREQEFLQSELLND
jgi:hypothetical protein